MRGLPYSVRKEDILYFFQGYNFYPEMVKIGENSDGTKTGEGAVLFNSEEEAGRAQKNLN